ncbi:UPF0481 protein [Cocos nucifera]|uniref:UPF0481 protein n=1 Tax=Cocos nucifera TaxID=13894 RepID=A0A8K0NE55_COCNU|nr:UPF0481 protein [Cocos nucifera]
MEHSRQVNGKHCRTIKCNMEAEIAEALSQAISLKIDEWLQAQQGSGRRMQQTGKEQGPERSSSSREAPQAIDRFLEKAFNIWLSLQNNRDASRKHDESCAIYRVPGNTRLHDKKAYEPVIVPIGPYHHVHKRLAFREMEAHKPDCISYLLSLAPNEGEEEELKTKCFAKLKELECRARSCYSEDTRLMEGEHFLEVLMRDGCFIIYLLLSQPEKSDDKEQADKSIKFRENARKQRRPLIDRQKLNEVKLDLLKMENQIPFFVVQALFDLIQPLDMPPSSLIDLALKFFDDLHLCKLKKMPAPSTVEVHHLLHLLYLSVTYVAYDQMMGADGWDPEDPSSGTNGPTWIPSATELLESGVKFRVKKNASSIMDVTFHNGLLEMPKLHIYNSTTPIICNLIAFEHYVPNTGSYVTSYVAFVNCLMHGEEDVRLLHLNGVVMNNMSTDKRVAEFFRRICPQGPIASSQNYLHDLFVKVTDHHSRKKNRWMAEARRNYCSSPCVTLSVLAGSCFLLLTIVQTVFTIIQTLHDLKKA